MQNDVEQNIEQINEKIAQIEKMVIRWPLFTHIINNIKECQERSKISTEPRCLLITGSAGYGKTTIGTYYAGAYQREATADGTTIPVFYTQIPSKATVKGFASRILEDLGDPLYDKGTTTNMTSRLCRLIKQCGVELIIMDEFQHLIDGDSDKVLKSTADWFKDILNRTKVPIVLMGMPHSVRILTANEQLRRRFAIELKLKAFRWTPEEERDDFFRFLMMLEKSVPMKKASMLHLEQTAYRIFHATNGIISNLKKLISKAAEITYKKGLSCITLEVLALAYNEELALSNPGNPNPFMVAYDSLAMLASSQNSQRTEGKDGGSARSDRRWKKMGSIANSLHK